MNEEHKAETRDAAALWMEAGRAMRAAKERLHIAKIEAGKKSDDWTKLGRELERLANIQPGGSPCVIHTPSGDLAVVVKESGGYVRLYETKVEL